LRQDLSLLTKIVFALSMIVLQLDSLKFISKDDGHSHTIRSAISKNPMLHANFRALCFIETDIADQSVALREYGFSTFSCNLDLDPMTFIYELDPYPIKI